MAQRGRQKVLLKLALDCLQDDGYIITMPDKKDTHGQNVRILQMNNFAEKALIQTRSFKPNTSTYLVGIIVSDLQQVDCVVLWFEGEQRYLKIPGKFLRNIHQEMRDNSLAKYTGDCEQQWRVNIHLKKGVISPQGANGKQYPIHSFLVEAPSPTPVFPGKVAQENLNVSGVCQRAIEQAVQIEELKLRTDIPSKEKVVLRLRMEKQEAGAKWKQIGFTDGVEDSQTLSYSDFKFFDLIDDEGRPLDLDYISDGWISQERLNQHSDPLNFEWKAYKEGWIEGVIHFWQQIKNDI